MGGAFGSLHVVLGSVGAGFGVLLVEGDALGFAHEGLIGFAAGICCGGDYGLSVVVFD